MASMSLHFPTRPCYVDDKKALFHGWIQESELYPPSRFHGGHSGGVVAGAYGIVEYENGRVELVRPQRIRFADREFDSYYWDPSMKPEIKEM